jgi:hypothetical protein
MLLKIVLIITLGGRKMGKTYTAEVCRSSFPPPAEGAAATASDKYVGGQVTGSVRLRFLWEQQQVAAAAASRRRGESAIKYPPEAYQPRAVGALRPSRCYNVAYENDLGP